MQAELSAVAAAVQQHPAALLLRGGVGDAAGRTAAELLRRENPPRLICSTGFCGGLADDLLVGDIVLASVVQGGHSVSGREVTPVPVVQALLERSATALQQQGIRHRVGGVISVWPAVTDCAAKRALWDRGRAVAVDLESYPIASASVPRAGVIVVRAVSDSVSDELPAEVGSFIDERGNVRAGAVLAHCLRRPCGIGRLWGLRNRSARAAAALTRAWQALWPVVSAEVSASFSPP